MPDIDPTTLLVAAIAVAGAIVGLIILILMVALIRLARDARKLTRSAQRVVDMTENELPQLLAELRQTSTSLARLGGEMGPRLERVDAMLDEADLALISLRATVETAEDMVRGPAAAIDRARRTVRAAGEGIARAAPWFRRGE